MKKPLVYMAAPYTRPDPVENTHKAMKRWEELRILNCCVPICPHWSMAQHLVTPQDFEYWMRYDFELIEHCHALIRYPGESSGADREVAKAQELGIPVFDLREQEWEAMGFKEWCEAWTARILPIRTISCKEIA